MSRILTIVLLAMLLALQYRLWFGTAGILPLQKLRGEQMELQAEIADKQRRNEKLRKDIRNLKHRLEALEELAREDLGLIKEGEHFFRVVRPAKHHAAESE